MLLLDLNLDHIGWVLDDLVDIRLVRTPNLAHDTLSKICEASNKPPLIERTITKAGRYRVKWDHAVNSVNGPCEEEDDKEMVDIPKPFKVRAAGLFDGSEEYCHNRDSQNVTRPARARQEVELNKTEKAGMVLRRELRDIV